MIEKDPGTDWRDLQSRVATILRESGLAAETAHVLGTARGTVEIDVYAIDPRTIPPAVYLCECKRWRQRVPQGEVHAFRTVVADAGTHFGLFISAEGFQSGAHEVVRHTNIHLLDWLGFQELFVERWCRNYWIPLLRHRGDRLASYVEPICSDASIRANRGEPLEPAEAVGLLVLDLWGDPFNDFAASILGQPPEPVVAAIWEHRDRYRQHLPPEAANAQHLRELLDALLAFIPRWLQETGRMSEVTNS